ncbi:hypothetical protein L211DRAFT_838401 [Terfezia boudieri ATCC MYA-4762]|uniref:Uncharacterized protein n=1 Tax=Terfezia boudieri ATCC MYA-4762 TaxID=1051890 RepID=A0A3N4LSD9_9PEZI|nr:hypothetical protein L211DRAFT_838401 [Terfezia boudieri ATCC MYA-4762]
MVPPTRGVIFGPVRDWGKGSCKLLLEHHQVKEFGVRWVLCVGRPTPSQRLPDTRCVATPSGRRQRSCFVADTASAPAPSLTASASGQGGKKKQQTQPQSQSTTP